MSDKPNNPFQFWQELKRRKVVRVITVYAAVAFVIIELINNITEPLGLPEWVPTLVIVLLAIGFLISIVMSWIFDITPEGIQKTKSAKEIDKAQKPPTSNIWKIISFVSVVIIVALVLFHIVSSRKQAEVDTDMEKSIAVLPFINDSPDEENTYFINGIMEEVLLNLQAIKDLRVPGRTSVEQYRNSTKSIPEIAKELDVNYIVEGSGQKYGNTIRLRIQLMDSTKDRHLWGESYEQEIESPEVIFRIQSQIAESIAAEVKAIITPKEKQLIEKTPTTSLTAYDFYQRGKDEYWKYWSDNDNRDALERAEDLYHKALEYDPTFAQAYTGLAWVYRKKHYRETYFSENFLDSVLILADIALSYDDQLAEAYTVRGYYYKIKGIPKKALEEYDKAIKFNPNDWMAYWGKRGLYWYDDLVKTIDNLQKAASLNHGPLLPVLLREIGWAYYNAGFIEKSKYYHQEALKLDGDSTTYYSNLAWSEYYLGNFEKAIEFGKKGYAIDSTKTLILLNLGVAYRFLGQHEESLKYIKKHIERLKVLGELDIPYMYMIGYIYWQNGYKEEAEYYFNETIKNSNRMIELGREYVQQLWVYYDLAAVYAFRGERDKAYKNLRIFNQRQMMHFWMAYFIKNDPLFDSIRDEPEFQQIIRDVEAKYQAEHERVRKWLEEEGML